MLKSQLLEKSNVVHPVYREAEPAIGSLNRAEQRAFGRLDRKRQFITEVQEEFGKIVPEILDHDVEAKVRSKATQISTRNRSEEKDLLGQFGLALDSVGQAALDRQNSELWRYPGTDSFENVVNLEMKMAGLAKALPEHGDASDSKHGVAENYLVHFLVAFTALLRIEDGALAVELARGAIFGASRLWNEIVCSAKKTVVRRGEEIEVDCSRAIIPRELLPLLIRIRNEVMGEEKFQSLISDREFGRKISKVVETAGLGKASDVKESLGLIGRASAQLSLHDVPGFLRGIYGGETQTTPMNFDDDYLFTSNQYPRLEIDGERAFSEINDFTDNLVSGVNPKPIVDRQFSRVLGEAYTEAEKSAKKDQSSALKNGIEHALVKLNSCGTLNWSQRYQLAFAWYMAYVGLPISQKYEYRGGLPSQRTYLSEIKRYSDIAFSCAEDGELTDDLCAEHIEAFLEVGFNQHNAGRYWYFLTCLEDMDLLERPTSSIIFGEASLDPFPSDAYLIPNRAYERALQFALEFGEDEGRLIQLALIGMRLFSLRRSEVWNSQFDHIQISKSFYAWGVGGRGRVKPKRQASNRDIDCYYELLEEEKAALEWFKDQRTEREVNRLDFVFHPKDKAHADVDKNRFFRKITEILRRATGNPRARPHHLRKTGLNELWLNSAAGWVMSPRMRYLSSQKVSRKMNLPMSLLVEGCRRKSVAEAVKRYAGHKNISSFVRGYLVFGAEFYSECISGNVIEKLFGQNIEAVTCGTIRTEKELFDIKNCKRPAGFSVPSDNITRVRPPKKFLQKTYRPESPLDLTPGNVARILCGVKLPEISAFSLRSSEVRDICHRVYSVAGKVASDIELSFWSEFDHGDDSLSPPRRVVEIERVNPVIYALDQLGGVHEASSIYGAGGLWQRSYRSNTAEFESSYVVEDEDELAIFLDELRSIGVPEESISVRCIADGNSATMLSSRQVEPEIISPRQMTFFRPRKMSDPAVITFRRLPGSQFEYPKQVVFCQFVFAVLAGLSETGVTRNEVS